MNILAAFAHPDDETIFIGGTLAMFASKGARVHLVSATRGEGGEVGEPPVCLQTELGSVREVELNCAAGALGANSLAFLDYVDPEFDEENNAQPFDADAETLAGQLLVLAETFGARTLITHGTNGEYGHPAHILLNKAAKMAVGTVERMSLFTISAAFQDHPRPRLANSDDPADFIFSIEPWFQQKLAAARCHRSQHALFVRRSSEEAGRKFNLAEVMMRVESLHHAASEINRLTDDALSVFINERCTDAILLDAKSRSWDDR
jgi:LmbE family N-acetylglucosaminyl deacetylase